MNKNLTFIVTGCTGYVGNVITKKLMSLGYNVIGLARNEEKVKKVFLNNSPTIIYGDIRNKEDIEELFIGEGPRGEKGSLFGNAQRNGRPNA